MGLEGKIAVVTGGSRGIGRGITLSLAQSGADVVICYRKDEAAAKDTVAQIEALGRKALAFQVDVSDAARVKEVVDQTIENLGKIDVLINNAGVTSRGKYICNTDFAELQRMMEVHVFGAFHFVRQVLPHMRKLKRGDIHFISSAATFNCHPGQGPYAMAKAALETMALVLAKEELPNNVRVNVISPGLVETEFGRRLVKATTGQDIKEFYQKMPFGRVCQPADIGNLCAFLCSEKGEYISGHIIRIDGGRWKTITD